MNKVLLFIYFILSSSNLYSRPFYIRPKAYLDVKRGIMIPDKIIGIENGKIISIDQSLLKKENISEMPELYLLPGLFDCHAHLFLTETIEDKNLGNALKREVLLDDNFRMTRAKEFLKQYLNEGFTSICDLGNSGEFLDVKLKKDILTDFKYPDVYISGQGIASLHGQFSNDVSPLLVKKEYCIISDKSDIDSILRKYVKMKVDILKIYLDNSPGEGGLSLNKIRQILSSSLIKNFKKVTFHAVERNSVEKLSGMGKFNIEHASNSIFSMKEKNDINYLTLTDLPEETLKEFGYYNKWQYNFQIYRGKEAYKKNIHLVFGPDFYFHRNDKLFNRAQYIKKSIKSWTLIGTTPIEIIRAMTINPARSLNELDKGNIAIGSFANIIGVRINPLTDINSLNSIDLIINKGRIFKQYLKNTLQKKK